MNKISIFKGKNKKQKTKKERKKERKKHGDLNKKKCMVIITRSSPYWPGSGTTHGREILVNGTINSVINFM